MVINGSSIPKYLKPEMLAGTIVAQIDALRSRFRNPEHSALQLKMIWNNTITEEQADAKEEAGGIDIDMVSIMENVAFGFDGHEWSRVKTGLPETMLSSYGGTFAVSFPEIDERDFAAYAFVRFDHRSLIHSQDTSVTVTVTQVENRIKKNAK